MEDVSSIFPLQWGSNIQISGDPDKRNASEERRFLPGNVPALLTSLFFFLTRCHIKHLTFLSSRKWLRFPRVCLKTCSNTTGFSLVQLGRSGYFWFPHTALILRGLFSLPLCETSTVHLDLTVLFPLVSSTIGWWSFSGNARGTAAKNPDYITLRATHRNTINCWTHSTDLQPVRIFVDWNLNQWKHKPKKKNKSNQALGVHLHVLSEKNLSLGLSLKHIKLSGLLVSRTVAPKVGPSIAFIQVNCN